MIREVRLPFFLLRPEVIFIGTTIGLLPLTQLIYLAVHKGLLVCRLGQMRKWGGVSKTMDFRIKLFFLSFFINNEVILERGLDFLIIPISFSRLSWKYLRGIIWSSEVTYVINILGTLITLLPFEFHLLHICRKRFYQLGQFIYLRVGRRGNRGLSFISPPSSISINFISKSLNCQYVGLYFQGCILHMSQGSSSSLS
jgi:hypothetical protein